MILTDKDGVEYEVLDDQAKKVPKNTRKDFLRSLIMEVVQEAVSVQRIVTSVQKHETMVNLGTEEHKNVQSFVCNANPGVDAKLLEQASPEAIANTVMTRLREHNFVTDEDLNTKGNGKAAKAAAKQ